jgi:hypothetical protein
MASKGVDPEAIGHDASPLGMLLIFTTNLVVLGGELCISFTSCYV